MEVYTLKLWRVDAMHRYARQRLLHGVIYLHPISANRVTGSTLRTLQLYRALCGPKYLQCSAVVTTMWDEVGQEEAARREAELKSRDKFFKPALDNGARFCRHDDSQTSAHTIIRALLTNTPAPLRIQEELVLEKKSLLQTEASEVLHRGKPVPPGPLEADAPAKKAKRGDDLRDGGAHGGGRYYS